MREIKFRAWSRIFKQIIEVDSIDFIKGYIYYTESDDRMERFVLKDCDLLQYTGLEDKNGKEIYEGDIINYKGVRFVIKFKEGRFYGWNNKLTQIGILSPIFEKMYASKLIGNIYENGNLLKGEKDGS